MQRRTFIRNAAKTTAAAIVPIAGAAAANGADLYARLSGQLGKTAETLHASLGEMSYNLKAVSGRVDYLELKYRLVMILLIISMFIDGGMTWMLMHMPVPVIV